MKREYHKWIARNEKPEEKRELTRKEKWNNWWHYHKWHVVIAAAAVLLVVYAVADIIENRQNQPDYQVAYIGSVTLPSETAASLETALAELGQDLNGNGKVQVQLNQYVMAENEVDYTTNYTSQVRLMADMNSCDSYFYLMEDPEAVQEGYKLLESTASGQLWVAWTDCPVLTGLELDGYTDLLSGLYIGRRVISESNDFKYLEGCEALWKKLTAGAEK